jgi:hypothetical protein
MVQLRPSTATVEGTGLFPEARHSYIALVKDLFHGREFYWVLSKEYIDDEVRYLVDWVPTLVRGRVLYKAKAQPHISQFEASCEKGKRVRVHQLNGSGVTDGTQSKRQARTLNMLRPLHIADAN